jgi:hypothetical protein
VLPIEAKIEVAIVDNAVVGNFGYARLIHHIKTSEGRPWQDALR